MEFLCWLETSIYANKRTFFQLSQFNEPQQLSIFEPIFNRLLSFNVYLISEVIETFR